MERKNAILYATFALAIIATILHVSANAFYFYWSYWWFDWLVHSLTGFTGALGIYWGLFLSGIIFRREPDNKLLAGILVLFFVILIGAGWEVFEYMNGITDSYESESYALDIVIDLTMDATGTVLAILTAQRKGKE